MNEEWFEALVQELERQAEDGAFVGPTHLLRLALVLCDPAWRIEAQGQNTD